MISQAYTMAIQIHLSPPLSQSHNYIVRRHRDVQRNRVARG